MFHVELLKDYPIVKNNKKRAYLNIECAFDIETTSHLYNGEKTAFMYLWGFGIGEDNEIVTGRTWAEFITLCETLQERYNLHNERRLICYVHNLAYEFQFMRKYFEWVEVFAVDERKPISALCTYGIEFRDSYILSGYSLANTAKNLTKHTIEKLTGDLDYSLIHHHETPLTEKEITYCEYDVKIVLYYINEQIAQYGSIDLIPKTNTGRVRKYVKDCCYYKTVTGEKGTKAKYLKYRKVMEDLTLTSEAYTMLKRAFMGGFTHSSLNHTGKVLTNVSSIDFTSSYPSVMLSEKFPMSRFKKTKITSLKTLKEYCKKYAVIFDVKFINLTPKISHENYISESKCYNLVGAVINNGRIFSANELCTTLTNIDFHIMTQCYEWEKILISNVQYAHQNYLPKPIIESVLKLYQDKTELKDVAGYEVEYLLSKGMLNSIYGMTVTDIVKPIVKYSENWEIEGVSLDEEITKYNESKNRFLYYAWGVWITAYARRNLWTGILATGDDYVYSDTDSLKILNYEKHTKYINWFNAQIVSKMGDMMEYYKLDKNLLKPKTKEGKEKLIGIWDFEGNYPLFKTLGAKRYLYQDGGKLKLTVAGLSKQNGVNYMLEKCNNDFLAVFNMFNDNLFIPSDKTGKMTHTYIDNEVQILVTDYTGKQCEVISLSGVYLEPCEFTLSISQQYKTFLNSLKNGFILKGDIRQ